jgi:hypothetical protein
MALIIEDLTQTYVFDAPEVEVLQRNQSLKSIPSCENKLASGTFYSVANKPRHGTKINKPINGGVEYVVFSLDTALSSSMKNCRIRFFDLEIDNLNYDDVRGVSNLFSGEIKAEFIANVKQVASSKALFLDRPLVVSNVALKKNIKEEGYQEGIKAGEEKERKRLCAIDSIAQPGFEKIIMEAKNTGKTLEETALMVLQETKKRGITLSQMKEDNQDIPPAPASEEDEEEEKKKEEKEVKSGLLEKIKAKRE